ncbi:MAG: hypothetical protein ACK5X3_23575 [Pseudomonadota bacterium]
MTDQHTPGPWTTDVVRSTNYTLRIIKAGTDWIAHVHTQSTESDIPRDVSNARLIAAAPDLLEACQTLSTLLDTDDWIYQVDRAVKQAQAAIAKVRGTQ